MYAACAWSGFASLTDKQRIDSFLKRGVRSGLCSKNVMTFDEMCSEYDSRLFNSVISNSNHVLYKLLPEKTASNNYDFRARPHDRELPVRLNSLTDRNFICRALYNGIY